MNRKVKAFFLLEIFLFFPGNYLSILLYALMTEIKKDKIEISWKLSYVFNIFINNLSDPSMWQILLIMNCAIICIGFYFAFFYEGKGKILKAQTITITEQIEIPVPAGNGEYGNGHFMDYKELDRVEEIACFTYYPGLPDKQMPQKGGIVIGIRAIGSLPPKEYKEQILYINKDRHALLVGATRSGKSRRMILLSIWLTILAGENMVVTDPKGELWAYTSPWAKEHEYNIVKIDFREPNKGSHHNYLQEIIIAVDEGDIAEAIDLVWDLVAVLVGEAKGEPIWHNGECAAIAACILIVVLEAPEEYKNLTNVYYFLFNMAKPDEMGEMPITRYLASLPETHPARAVFAMAEIAHTKTRGSFFSSALGTLRHFTNPKIAEMTSQTDYKFSQMANEKTIVYIILPDEKTTLYGLGSMYIMQHYIYNVKSANKNGGRCPVDWWYFLDEFGQLPYIPPIPQFLSVGAGRGMRFLLALQDFQQLEKRYKDDYDTIKNNCDCWIYLKCSNEKTKEEFSKRCRRYTIQLNSTNYNLNSTKGNNGNYSASLTGRDVLTPDEVGMIEAPYSLITFAGKNPIMLIAPDLSYYYANEEMGLGDEEHNKQIIIQRNSEIQARPISEINLWGIWNEFKEMDEYADDYEDEYEGGGEYEDEAISFL